MKPTLPNRRILPHEAPHWVPEWEPFFITINCLPRGQNQLCIEPAANQILESMKESEKRQIWSIGLVVLMPDHLHAILHFNPVPGMRVSLINWKKMVARRWKINWQRDFFDHRLRNDAEYAEKFAYVSMNPVRAGLVAEIGMWPHRWPRLKME